MQNPAPRPHRDEHIPSRTRRILHLDVDAFLASVEQALHPELRGLPLVVGGLPTERNLVMSCSYEARAFGVRPGMRLAEAARRCPRAVFRRGDSQAANAKREEIAHLLRRVTPLVEVSSIDDLFADLTGTGRLWGAACDVAERLHHAIRDEVGLPVTIGVGTTRTFARLAGKLAKPGGVAEILPGHELDFLRHLPVEQLPGVGHALGAHLARFAVRTVGDLQQVSREVLFASFGHPGLVLFERAHGRDDDPVQPTFVEAADGTLRRRIPGAIHRDSTFEPEEGRRELVEAMLAYVVDRAAHRLRGHGARAASLEVHVLYVDTRTPAQRRAARHARAPADGDAAPLRRARRALPAPSDSTDALVRHARALFRSLPRRRALVKRVGVVLRELAPSAGWQGHLFSDPAKDRPAHAPSDGPPGSRADRQRRLDHVLDHLRERHGFGRLLRGASWPLAETHPLTRDGFRLRTPSLNQ